MALRNTRGRKTTTKMHSSQLRGDDFSVRQGDEEISHPVFFHGRRISVEEAILHLNALEHPA